MPCLITRLGLAGCWGCFSWGIRTHLAGRSCCYQNSAVGAEVLGVCCFGYEDEGFDWVGYVGCADAESCADEVECFLVGLPFAGFDPVKVTGGCVGFDGE